jgi:hypothetical protein
MSLDTTFRTPGWSTFPGLRRLRSRTTRTLYSTAHFSMKLSLLLLELEGHHKGTFVAWIASFSAAEPHFLRGDRVIPLT